MPERLRLRPTIHVAAGTNISLILRSIAKRCVSKDGPSRCLGPSFETAAQERGLLRMRSVGIVGKLDTFAPSLVRQAKPDDSISSERPLPPLWRRRDIRRKRSDGAAQLAAQFLRNKAGVDAVANDLRPDEDDELGSIVRFVLVGEGVAQILNLIEQRNAGAGAGLLLLN